MLKYLRARLAERTTWAAIGAGVTAAALLPWPWSLVAAIIATIGALTPIAPQKGPEA